VNAPDFSTRPRARRLPPLDLGLLVAGLLAAALTARGVWIARAEGEVARTHREDVDREIAAARQRIAALEKRAGDGLTDRAWLSAEAPPPRVLRALGELLPPDVRLDGLVLTYGRALELEMRVVARGPRAYDRLLERLEGSPRLRDLVLGAESRQGEVATTVRATFVPGP
jgi:hypothetical protein